MDQLLTAQDLADRLRCSVSKIYRLRCYHPDQLPPTIKFGNHVRWRLDDVEAWETNREKTGAKA